jgi:hypothetical protein
MGRKKGTEKIEMKALARVCPFILRDGMGYGPLGRSIGLLHGWQPAHLPLRSSALCKTATLCSLSCRQQSPCSGVESGFCGIQHDDRHPAYPPSSNSSIVLINAIPRAKATSIKRRRVPSPDAMGSLAWEIRLGTLHLKRWGARHQRGRGSSSDLGTQGQG